LHDVRTVLPANAIPRARLPVVMHSDVDPAALLAGPRGRRLCWELLTQTGGGGWKDPPESAGPAGLTAAVGDAVARSDVEALAFAREPASFFLALADAVAWAMYWQEPDDRDRRLADPRVAEQLWPVAEAVSRAPAARWFSTPMDPADQHEVVFENAGRGPLPDPPHDGRSALLAWRADTLEDERRAAERPDDPRAPYSGSWWSTPALSPLRRSTRSHQSLGPVGLHLVEDALGWASARSWTLQLRPHAAIFEIQGADDWAELVERYPFAVTRSRRHDWYRATGLDLEWTIPDFYAVAGEYDAVHLTVAGYLSTAGRAIRAGQTHTVLAGWHPDETWWLTDSPQRVDPAVRWLATGESEPFAWTEERVSD
jgi:hypothetical protein